MITQTTLSANVTADPTAQNADDANKAAELHANNLAFDNGEKNQVARNISGDRSTEQVRLTVLAKGSGHGVAALATHDEIATSGLLTLQRIWQTPATSTTETDPTLPAGSSPLAALIPLLGAAQGGKTESQLTLSDDVVPLLPHGFAGALLASTTPELMKAGADLSQRISALIQKVWSQQLSDGARAQIAQSLGAKAQGVLAPFVEQIPKLRAAIQEIFAAQTQATPEHEIVLPPPALHVVEQAFGSAFGQAAGLCDFSSADIDALIFMVMTEAADEQTHELQDSINDLKANNLAKQAQRQKMEAMNAAQAKMKSAIDQQYYALHAAGTIQPSVTLTQFESGVVVNWGDGQCDDTTGTYSGPAPYWNLPSFDSSTWKSWTTPPPPPTAAPGSSASPVVGGDATFGLSASKYKYFQDDFASLPASVRAAYPGGLDDWLQNAPDGPKLTPLPASAVNPSDLSNPSDPSSSVAPPTAANPSATLTTAAANDQAADAWAKSNDPSAAPPPPTDLTTLTAAQISALSPDDLQTLLAANTSTFGKLLPDQLSAVLTVLLGGASGFPEDLKSAFAELQKHFPQICAAMTPPLPTNGVPNSAAWGTAPLTAGNIVNALIVATNYQEVGEIGAANGFGSPAAPWSSDANAVCDNWGKTILSALIGGNPEVAGTVGQLILEHANNLVQGGADPVPSISENGIFGFAVPQMVSQGLSNVQKNGYSWKEFQDKLNGSSLSDFIDTQVSRFEPPASAATTAASTNTLKAEYSAAFNGTPSALAQLPSGLFAQNSNGGWYIPTDKWNALTANQQQGIKAMLAGGLITVSENQSAIDQQAAAKLQEQQTQQAVVAQINAGNTPPDLAGQVFNATGGFASFTTACDNAKSDLDTLGDMTTTMQMSIQLEQSQYSQIMEALSNVMKKMADTGQAIVENMK